MDDTLVRVLVGVALVALVAVAAHLSGRAAELSAERRRAADAGRIRAEAEARERAEQADAALARLDGGDLRARGDDLARDILRRRPPGRVPGRDGEGG